MQAMDTELLRLVREGVITPEEAYMRASSKKEFEKDESPVSAPAAPPGRAERS
jgi:Tfp pilus assembly pilus retraction ATPase PilT